MGRELQQLILKCNKEIIRFRGELPEIDRAIQEAEQHRGKSFSTFNRFHLLTLNEQKQNFQKTIKALVHDREIALKYLKNTWGTNDCTCFSCSVTKEEMARCP